jgi:glycosyltransferase involved in cell wall biosynthesis
VKSLRFGLVLDQAVEVGGGFQQPLSDLIWLRQWAQSVGHEILVFSPHPRSISLLAELGIKAELLKFGFLDHVVLFLKYLGAFDLIQIFLRLLSPFEKRLLRSGVNIVYFATPSKWHLLLYRLPFIITVFDGCHRDVPEFDEVRAFGEFERRELLYRSAVTKAVLVIANDAGLIDSLCRRYAMERDRAVCIPFSPSSYVGRPAAEDEVRDAEILKKYNLQPGYLFYPAGFWPHKNHATLLAAVVLLRERNQPHRLVLCGSDYGHRGRIEELVAQHGLGQQVFILGFVDSTELGALYRSASALVMPSYFGPTNLPPLEAWAVGTPVIYPEAFKAQVGDAAVLFDYDSPDSLADAIAGIGSTEVADRLRRAGKDRLQEVARQTEAGRQQFAAHIKRLAYRMI